MARSLVEHLSAALGQPFIVDNRSGAGGNVGGAAVAKAAPDGYTLLLSTTGPASINKLTYKTMPYDPQRDLAPIVLMGKAAVIIVGRNGLPASTLKEFIEYAKQNPGKITAGYPGNGTQGHISGELLQQRTGINFAQTQYRGSPAIISDILGEHIDIGMDSMAPYVALIKEKKLRGLAIASATRWPQLPDVPTVAESGFPGSEAAVWYALLAPAGTPPEIIAKLNEAGNAYLKTKAAAELFEKLGIQASGGTPQQLKAFVDAEIEKWAPIIKAAKIEF
jgi:tripartite-type tricarboxylate transporter receptor subunit TctC